MLALGLLATVGSAGCRADESHTALAIESMRWVDADHLAVGFECAEVESTDLHPWAGVDNLPLLTAWGTPKVGTCTSEVVFEVHPSFTRFTDAATGGVVALPPRPGPGTPAPPPT